MNKIVKVEQSEDRVYVTVKVKGKEIKHEIKVSDKCIDCPFYVGQCAVNCYKLG